MGIVTASIKEIAEPKNAWTFEQSWESWWGRTFTRPRLRLGYMELLPEEPRNLSMSMTTCVMCGCKTPQETPYAAGGQLAYTHWLCRGSNSRKLRRCI
jgi:hypothetical protein